MWKFGPREEILAEMLECENLSLPMGCLRPEDPRPLTILHLSPGL